jgi:hypothetical protein
MQRGFLKLVRVVHMRAQTSTMNSNRIYYHSSIVQNVHISISALEYCLPKCESKTVIQKGSISSEDNAPAQERKSKNENCEQEYIQHQSIFKIGEYKKRNPSSTSISRIKNGWYHLGVCHSNNDNDIVSKDVKAVSLCVTVSFCRARRLRHRLRC